MIGGGLFIVLDLDFYVVLEILAPSSQPSRNVGLPQESEGERGTIFVLFKTWARLGLSVIWSNDTGHGYRV